MASDNNKTKETSEMSDSEYARVGIALWLNNKPLEAEDHFKKRKNKLQVEAGYTFISFLNAIISWETSKIEEAQKQLRELDKHSASENGWLKTVRVKLFGSNTPAKTLAQTLEEQIIMADSQLCSSILVGLTQDIGGMMKAGWSLRKAWKLYQTSYTQISELYRQKFQSNLHNNTSGGSYKHPNLHHERKRWSRDETDCEMDKQDSSSKDEIQPYPLPNDSPSHCYDIPSFVVDDDDKTKNGYNLDNNVASTSKDASTSSVVVVTPKMPKSYTTTFSETIQQSNSSPSTDLYPANNSTTTDTDNDASDIITARCLNKNASLDDNLVNNGYNKQSVTTSYSMNEFHHNPHPNAYHQQHHHYRQQCQDISKEDLQRLMSAVSFGYGLFQLSVSLLPPNLLKLISFFGFEGDRRTGITCLKRSRQSDDMRAPLATLSLLWYYTIITPFFALDGSNLDSEIEEANSLLEEAQDGFADAALFLFFKGRVERLKSNIPNAIVAYETSHRMSMQREIKLLCLHEIGWCRLIQLEFGKAMNHFDELKHHSQFSKSFYAYMMAICQAAHGNMENLVAAREEIYGFISSSYLKDFWDEFVFDQTPNAVYLQDSQIEKYILRRVSKLPLEEIEREKFEQIYWKYLVYEMLIMWNAINSCSEETLKVIMEDCKRPNRDLLNEPMKGLAKLVLATCHTCLKNYDEAIIAYRECIEQRGELLDDLHISAFAHFELATLLLKHRNDRVEARRLLCHVQNNYHNYDFENRLGIRVHSTLKSLT